MSHAFSPASQATDATVVPSTRAGLIDAVHDLTWQTRDALDDDALGLGEQILAVVRSGQVLDADEAARAEVVLTELLDGADSAYAWERVADAELYEAWMAAQTEQPTGDPRAWLQKVAPAGQFADAIHLFPVRVDPHRRIQLSRDELRSCLSELYEHMDTDPMEHPKGATTWELETEEMTTAIVSTIRDSEHQAVTRGEAARLERLVAAIASFEEVRGVFKEDAWQLACDPDAYSVWLNVRAMNIINALTADPREWTNSRGEFVDAIGLRPFRTDSLQPADYQLLDRTQIEQAFAELATAADPFMEQTLLTRDRDLLDGAERRFAAAAESILVTARATNVLTVSEAGRAERVVAALAAGEWSPDIVRDGQAWQLVTNPDAYSTWMTARNSAIHTATEQDHTVSLEPHARVADSVEPDWNSSQWRQTDAAIAAERIIEDPALAEQLLTVADHAEVVTAIVETAHGQLREWQSLREDYNHLRGELKQLRADNERLQSAAQDFAADLGVTSARMTVAPQAYSLPVAPEFPVPVNTQSVEPSQPWWRPISQGLGLGARSERGASR
ncbi:hypothetical protein AB0H00_29615 [Nocardia sp. NPDC023852]|uniref:hypothetical protein n=1 Tax=Nocardia sp. NPDC023852 TaxID=3154697 RepID=UPI0033C76FA2